MTFVDVLDPNLSPETPDLAQVIATGIRQSELNLRVAMPCVVTKVRGNQLVDIQPLIMARIIGIEDPVKLPIISAAPVAMPMGANWGIKYPVAVGDTGMAIFADRSLDLWSQGQGGLTDPKDTRLHNLSDAVFYPGLVPTRGQTTDTTTDMTLRNGAGVLRITQAGQFKLTNGQVDLVSTLAQVTQALVTLANAVSLTANSPAVAGSPVNAGAAANATAQANAAQTLLTQLNALKEG